MKNEEGFTLIEILVVILIIGILAAIAIPVFLNQRKAAGDAAVHSDAKNVLTAVNTLITDKKASAMPIVASEVKTVLGGAGKGLSAGATVAVSGHSEEYCILVRNSRANMDSWSVPGKYLYYNSKNGGWQDTSVMWHSTSCASSTTTDWSHFYG